MTVTITRATDSATATALALILPYELTDESRNVETDLLNGDLAITLVAPRSASVQLTYFFADEADARAARDLHRAASTFSVNDSSMPSLNMDYALGSGGQVLAIDSRGTGQWTLQVSIREVES